MELDLNKKKLSKYGIILFFLPFLWRSVYRFRRFLYKIGLLKSLRSSIPVISIGNITFGGTGKTPLILWLIQFFERQNKKVLILARGYKGNYENNNKKNENVLLKNHPLFLESAICYGDEPVMLARHLGHGAIAVGKNRIQNLIKYVPTESPDVILLDDGFQHLKIARDLDIVLINSQVELDSYVHPPFGELREGLTSLKDADIVVFTKVSDINSEKRLDHLRQFFKPYISERTPLFYTQNKPDGLFNSQFECIKNKDELKGLKVIALTGIGYSEDFFNSLNQLDMQVIDKIIGKDHEYFALDLIEKLLLKAEKENAYLVVTEKDMVKIRDIGPHHLLCYLGNQLKFVADESHFSEVLSSL